MFGFLMIVVTALAALKKHLRLEAKQKADLLQSYEEASRLSRIKTRFVAVASHEIRNPLAGIAGVDDLARRLDLELVGEAEGGAVPGDGVGYRLGDHGMAVTEDVRAQAEEVVDVLVPVDVDHA